MTLKGFTYFLFFLFYILIFLYCTRNKGVMVSAKKITLTYLIFAMVWVLIAFLLNAIIFS